MTRIQFDPSMPDELRVALEPYFEELDFLIPTWCHRIHVTNATDAFDGETAGTQIQPEYRQAFIYFSPLWLEAAPEIRKEAVVHELMHLPIEPMRQVLLDLLDASDDEDNATAIREQWRKAFEGAVCDLSYAFRVAGDV